MRALRAKFDSYSGATKALLKLKRPVSPNGRAFYVPISQPRDNGKDAWWFDT